MNLIPNHGLIIGLIKAIDATEVVPVKCLHGFADAAMLAFLIFCYIRLVSLFFPANKVHSECKHCAKSHAYIHKHGTVPTYSTAFFRVCVRACARACVRACVFLCRLWQRWVWKLSLRLYRAWPFHYRQRLNTLYSNSLRNTLTTSNWWDCNTPYGIPSQTHFLHNYFLTHYFRDFQTFGQMTPDGHEFDMKRYEFTYQSSGKGELAFLNTAFLNNCQRMSLNHFCCHIQL